MKNLIAVIVPGLQFLSLLIFSEVINQAAWEDLLRRVYNPHQAFLPSWLKSFFLAYAEIWNYLQIIYFIIIIICEVWFALDDGNTYAAELNIYQLYQA